MLAGISERRIDRLVNPSLNEELPPFLANHAGLESGFMMLQVTAAALVAENRVLAHPASTGSITTSGNKEDFVSMGMTSAMKLKQVVRNTRLRSGYRAAHRHARARLPTPAQLERGDRAGTRGTRQSQRSLDRRSAAQPPTSKTRAPGLLRTALVASRHGEPRASSGQRDAASCTDNRARARKRPNREMNTLKLVTVRYPIAS